MIGKYNIDMVEIEGGTTVYKIHKIEKKEVPSNETKCAKNYKKASIELATSIKKAISQSGMSRQQVADRINTYFEWPTAEEIEKMKKAKISIKKIKHLSYYMLDHYLSKPAEYPIKGVMLYAIHHVTGSLEPCKSLAEAEEGVVVNRSEKQALVLGKMEQAIYDMKKLRRELKGKQEQL